MSISSAVSGAKGLNSMCWHLRVRRSRLANLVRLRSRAYMLYIHQKAGITSRRFFATLLFINENGSVMLSSDG